MNFMVCDRGTGGSYDPDVTMSRSEMKLARAAANNRWPVTDDQKAETTTKVYASLQAARTVQDVVACARTLVAFEAQNQADEHLAIKAEMEANRPPSVVNLTQTNIYANLPADKRAELESFKAMLEGG